MKLNKVTAGGAMPADAPVVLDGKTLDLSRAGMVSDFQTPEVSVGAVRHTPTFSIVADHPRAIAALQAALPILGIPESEQEKILRAFELYGGK